MQLSFLPLIQIAKEMDYLIIIQNNSKVLAGAVSGKDLIFTPKSGVCN